MNDVERLAERAQREGRFGIDTEFMPEGRYRPLLCLVQLCVGGEIAVLDPLEGFDPAPLAEVLADPAVQVVLHAGRQDVAPLAAVVYYVNRSSERISAPPEGIAMLAGNSVARSRQPKGIASWSCGAIGGRPRYATIPACDPDSLLQLQATFPNCWDGKRLDSPDHRQHVKYASRGVCPAGAPQW